MSPRAIRAVFDDVEAADRVLGLHRVTARAVAANHLTEGEGGRWLHHLANERFFAAAALFVVTAVA
ncbi:hypothetical protein AB0L41_47545 [Amycolatopsis mediterranei]|uniref:hypothetical protein n=1 Tax=Amycolatopsis mediterranei TaxID=33910 RepID=UPI00344032C6